MLSTESKQVGREFLTFLFFEIQSNQFVPTDYQFEFYKAKIVPVFKEGAVTTVTSVSGLDSARKEMSEALLRGGLVEFLGIACTKGTGTYKFLLNSDLSIRSFKSPDTLVTVAEERSAGKPLRSRKKEKGENVLQSYADRLESYADRLDADVELQKQYMQVVESLISVYFDKFLMLRHEQPAVLVNFFRDQVAQRTERMVMAA